MTSTLKSWMGIPVEIDELYQSSRAEIEQWGMDKFEELAKPLLEAGVSIKWSQYTPFFNDGDVCEFSTGEVYFRIDEDSEAGDDEDGFLELYSDELRGGVEEKFVGYEYYGEPDRYGYQRQRGVYEPTGRVFTKHPMYDQMDALASAFGHFEVLLYKLFGDHAEITMTPEKIVKEYYSHD